MMRALPLWMLVLGAGCSRYEAPPEIPVLVTGAAAVGRVCEAIEVSAVPVDDETVTWTVEAAPALETLPEGDVVSADVVLSASEGATITMTATTAGQYFLRATAPSGSDLVKVTVTETVTTTADVVDADDGEYSLRELVGQAQSCPGDHRVVLPQAAVLRLDAPLVIDDPLGADNELVLDVPLTGDPLGPQPQPTVLTADGPLLEVTATVALFNVSLQGGRAGTEGGGAVHVAAGGAFSMVGGYQRAAVAGASAEEGGGAIHLAAGARGLVLVGVELSDSSTSGDGGAVHVEDGTGAVVQLVDTVVRGNQADGRGGGLFQRGGAVQLDDVRFEDNVASEGGALCLDGVTLDGEPTFDGNLPADACGPSPDEPIR